MNGYDESIVIGIFLMMHLHFINHRKIHVISAVSYIKRRYSLQFPVWLYRLSLCWMCILCVLLIEVCNSLLIVVIHRFHQILQCLCCTCIAQL